MADEQTPAVNELTEEEQAAAMEQHDLIDKVRAEDEEFVDSVEERKRERGLIPAVPDPEPTLEERTKADQESVQEEETKSKSSKKDES